MGNLLSERAFTRTRSFARVANPEPCHKRRAVSLTSRVVSSSYRDMSRRILKLELESGYLAEIDPANTNNYMYDFKNKMEHESIYSLFDSRKMRICVIISSIVY